MLPDYPLSQNEKSPGQAPDSPPAEGARPPSTATDAENGKPQIGVLPSQMSFAQEVRADRLGILWRVTLFAAFMIWWIGFIATGGTGVSLAMLMIPGGLVAAGCVLAGFLLRRDQFTPAVYAYALGAILGIGAALSYDYGFGQHFAPFIFPLLIFVVGLLLSMRDTFILTALTVAVLFFGPSLSAGHLTFTDTQAFAVMLALVAAGLSVQVSGELYAIAEWALENYRKERSTTFALFESRTELERSFMRQQALTTQLQSINEELEVARKAEEEAKHFRGQFLANMSHELRTPLNAIIGFSQTMLDFPAMYDDVQLPAQYRDDMTQVLSSGKHLLAIINDILDLSKVDAGKLELEIQPVDLGPILKGVTATAVGLVGDKKARIDLQREAPDPLPMVLGDPLRVRQVMLNFYSNAAKFTDQGFIKLIVRVEGSEVILGVQDSGTGIAEEDKATIFEEFRQGTTGRKKGRQGAGLGLAISQQLVRLMKGRLWFESTLGKGSTFYFALPLHQPAESEAKDGDEKPAAETVASEIVTGPLSTVRRDASAIAPPARSGAK